MNRNLIFDTIGSTAKRTMRAINPDRIASDVSFDLEKSEGVRLSVAFMPHKYSPSIKSIHTVSNEDYGIAIPKGTIVSAVPVLSEQSYIDDFALASGTAIAEIVSGRVVLGHDYAGNDTFASVEHPLYGYGKVVNAAVIANGGTLVNDLYTTYDAASLRVDANGTVVTAGSTTFTRAANVPVGIAQEDIYINREGQYLNASESSFQLFDSVLTDWLIAVPYIINGAQLQAIDSNSCAVTCTVSTGTQTKSAAYAAIVNQGIACLVGNDGSTAYSVADLMQLGTFVKSDYNGKFVLQNTWPNALTATPNAQTVGKVVAVDNKFPKDLEDTVQTSPLGHSGGTQTYGLPLELYRLIYYVLASGSSGVANVTYDNIMNLVNAAEAGIVWINLHIN